jgi:hypothetical protein
LTSSPRERAVISLPIRRKTYAKRTS